MLYEGPSAWVGGYFTSGDINSDFMEALEDLAGDPFVEQSHKLLQSHISTGSPVEIVGP